MRERSKSYWAGLTPQQRAFAVERLQAVVPKAGHRDAESRQKTGSKSRQWWAALSATERAERIARLRAQNTGNRFTHSASVRKRISDARRLYWASLTPEQLREYAARTAPKLLALRLAMLPNVRRTKIELAVGAVLDTLGVAYEQQKPIGPYVADFYLPERNLDLECDGEYWHSIPRVQSRDRRRDGWFKWKGYSVIRLKECEIRADAMTCVSTALGM